MKDKLLLICIVSLIFMPKLYAQNDNKLFVIGYDSKINEYKTNSGYDVKVTLEPDPSSFVDEIYDDNSIMRTLDMTVNVVISKSDELVFSKTITKYDFPGIFDRDLFKTHIIHHFDFEEEVGDWIDFMVTLCKPDSDWCYDFSTKINPKTQEILYGEIPTEEEVWDEY